MKKIHTNRVDSFENWRVSKISKYGLFNWVQLNYDPETSDIISLIFEEKSNGINKNIESYLLRTHKSHIINFYDPTSRFYIKDISTLKDQIGLQLLTDINNDNRAYSYWNYRLKTKPQNCLTADVDSLEFTKHGITIIEAAQLFDTSSILNAIPHIFRTFNLRPNKVNPKQYYSQYKYAKDIKAKSYILFHRINDNILDERSPVLLLENNENFYNMLTFILRLDRYSESVFLQKYSNYLAENLIQFKNIDDAYEFIKSN